MLLALTAASRGSEISYLNKTYMICSSNSYKFTFDKLIKSWRKGRPPPSIEFSAFPTEEKLCVVKTLHFYLSISQEWRNNGQTQLLLSTVKPHEVKKSTIAG